MESRSSKPAFIKKLSSKREFIGLLPITGWQIFFYLVPLAFLMVISFWMTKDYQIVSTWNLENYKAVFTDPLVRVAFFRSLGITLTTLVITILAAYPFAYSLDFKVPIKYRHVILIAIIAPFWTNYLVRVYSWQLILGGSGVVNHMLSFLGIIDSPLNILYTHIATRIGLLHFLISVMILNLYGTLGRSIQKLFVGNVSLKPSGPCQRYRFRIYFLFYGLYCPNRTWRWHQTCLFSNGRRCSSLDRQLSAGIGTFHCDAAGDRRDPGQLPAVGHVCRGHRSGPGPSGERW